MKPVISTPIVLFLISVGAVSVNACELIFMKIPYTDKLIDDYLELIGNVNSVQECVEYCTSRDDVMCKSVGIDASSMDCYLYDGRVYAGLPGTVNTDMVYYWQLEAECPIHVGYSEDPTSKICSKYNSTAVTWVEAQDQCQKEKGSLLSVDTPEKTTLFNEYASNTAFGTKLFLGATDIGEENIWNWLNGIPIDRSTFLTGQPNNINNVQHCLIFKNVVPSGFDDTSCADNNYRYSFICEVPTRIAYNT